MFQRISAAWNALIARRGDRPWSGNTQQSQRNVNQWHGWSRWGINQGSKVDYAVAAGPPWQNPVVTACLGWMSDRIGQAEMKVVRCRRDGTRTPRPDHPMTALIARPNEHYSGRALLAATMMSYIIDGNAYWVKVRSLSDDVVELWHVPAWRVIPRWPEDGSEFVSHYEIIIDGQHIAFPRSEVVHFRDGIDPHNDRLGMGRLKAALREICSLNEAASYTYTMLRNMGVPGLVFSAANDQTEISEDVAVRLKDYAMDRTGDGRFRPMVIPDGQVKVESVGFSPQQMDLKDLPLRDEAILCAVIGIPPEVVGAPSGNASKTYASQTEAVRSAWGRLQSILEAWAVDLDQDLLPDFEPTLRVPSPRVALKTAWCYDQVPELQDDITAKVDRALRMFGTATAVGIVTRNEAREMVGLDPLPSAIGDVLADGMGIEESYADMDEPDEAPPDGPGSLESDSDSEQGDSDDPTSESPTDDPGEPDNGSGETEAVSDAGEDDDEPDDDE